MILRGRVATVVEDRVPFLVESELFRGQVRCRSVENMLVEINTVRK